MNRHDNHQPVVQDAEDEMGMAVGSDLSDDDCQASLDNTENGDEKDEAPNAKDNTDNDDDEDEVPTSVWCPLARNLMNRHDDHQPVVQDAEDEMGMAVGSDLSDDECQASLDNTENDDEKDETPNAKDNTDNDDDEDEVPTEELVTPVCLDDVALTAELEALDDDEGLLPGVRRTVALVTPKLHEYQRIFDCERLVWVDTSPPSLAPRRRWMPALSFDSMKEFRKIWEGTPMKEPDNTEEECVDKDSSVVLPITVTAPEVTIARFKKENTPNFYMHLGRVCCEAHESYNSDEYSAFEESMEFVKARMLEFHKLGELFPHEPRFGNPGAIATPPFVKTAHRNMDAVGEAGTYGVHQYFTSGGIHKVYEFAMKKTGFGVDALDSCFSCQLDLGHGTGRMLVHAALCSNAVCLGVEVDRDRHHEAALTNIIQNVLSNPDTNNHRCYAASADIKSLDILDPATHVFYHGEG